MTKDILYRKTDFPWSLQSRKVCGIHSVGDRIPVNKVLQGDTKQKKQKINSEMYV